MIVARLQFPQPPPVLLHRHLSRPFSHFPDLGDVFLGGAEGLEAVDLLEHDSGQLSSAVGIAAESERNGVVLIRVMTGARSHRDAVRAAKILAHDLPELDLENGGHGAELEVVALSVVIEGAGEDERSNDIFYNITNWDIMQN